MEGAARMAWSGFPKQKKDPGDETVRPYPRALILRNVAWRDSRAFLDRGLSYARIYVINVNQYKGWGNDLPKRPVEVGMARHFLLDGFADDSSPDRPRS